MTDIVGRLRRAKEQIGNISSILLDIVNAGDQISRSLGIDYRPALFQDLHDKWQRVSDVESTIYIGIDTIEAQDQIIAGLLEAIEPFANRADEPVVQEAMKVSMGLRVMWNGEIALLLRPGAFVEARTARDEARRALSKVKQERR